MMKLNNKGQVLVLFVVMFPIIFFLVAYFIENMLITSEKNKINNIGELAIKYAYENKDDIEINSKLNNLVMQNDKDIEIKKFTVNTDNIVISLYKNIGSIFGKIIGIKKYDVTSNYEASFTDDKVIYTRK